MRRLLVVLSVLLVAFAFSIALPDQAIAQASGGDNSGILNGFLSSMFESPADAMKTKSDAVAAAINSAGCWSCTIFNSFAGVAFVQGSSVSAQAAGPLTAIISGFGTVFALFYLGSSFVSGDASDLLQRWKVFWRLLIACAAGSAVLSANAFEFAWTVVYGPLMDIALAVYKAFAAGGETCSSGASFPGAPSGAMASLQAMGEIVCGSNKIANQGIGFGVALMFTWDGITGWAINLITGLILCIIFGWIAITFPLRFIDALIRLGVVGIVTPVLVVCAVFKPTRSYVQIGISNVLYAGAEFAFTGIMFALGSKVFKTILNEQMGSMGTMDPTTQISRAFVLIGTGVIFAAMTRMAPSLAAEFSAFRGSTGGGVGGAAVGAMSNVVSTTTSVAGAGAGYAIAGRAAGGAAGRAMGGAAGGAEGGGVAGALGKGVT